ncbi:hypothetical protein Q9L58_009425 [Maublancomyces gigas]|uniref:Uncharacterized protein n=1 Tax=Discina gigas TaxID=1032678 RepID=A0ABR3G7C4_9PEZI
MASPDDITTQNLTGKFYMNKTHSSDTDEMLMLQGVSWFTRKAIRFSTITLDIKQYRDDDGVEHIDIDQTATGGIKGTTENRTLDWTEREHEDHLFGKLAAKSRRLDIEQVEAGFLKDGFLPEAKKDGVIESFVVNHENQWSAQQIWGFEEIDKLRYYVRHLRFKKFATPAAAPAAAPETGESPPVTTAGSPEKVIEMKLVYDYAGV